MNIGYACLALGVPSADFRNCIQKNAIDEKLTEANPVVSNQLGFDTLISIEMSE